MARHDDEPVLTEQEHRRLIGMCSAAAFDPNKMLLAVERMFRALDPKDREYMKLRLRLAEGDTTSTRTAT